MRRAEAFTASVGPIALELRREGLSLRRVAAELANRDVRTPRGGAWTAHAVRVLLARVGAASRGAGGRVTTTEAPPADTRGDVGGPRVETVAAPTRATHT